ncbi:M56 family metallopeptidase [Aquiflexum sp.]|uniref:M56 family metallopeptidase n=1 Tax=Aquiflexum sp. TaxID=1872584 RepID=UPI003593D61E
MELLETLLPQKYLFALGWMILHAIWQIAGIGLILWLVLRIFQQKSAAFKYRLSIGALFLISTLAIGSFLFHLQEKPYAKEFTFTQTDLDYYITQGYTLDSSADVGSTILAPYSDWSTLSKRIETWIPFMVQLWVLGAMLFLVRFGTSLADLRNISNKNHQMVDPKWMQLLQQQMALLQLNKPIKLLKTIHLDMPVTYGVWKSFILIPASLFFHLSPEQLEAILAHELAHIKRYDYLVNLFQSFLEVIFFFHPVFWWINKTARELRENACDDMAINMGIAPKDLAHGLANVLNHANKLSPEMAMAAAKTRNHTLDRIKRIMGVKTSPTQLTTLTSITMMITLLIGATLMVGASDKPSMDSLEDLVATETEITTTELDIPEIKFFAEQDTVPLKKKRIFQYEGDSITERELTPEEHAEISKKLAEGLKPLAEMGIIFKDLDFNFFSNMPQLRIGEPLMPPMDFDDMPQWEFDDMQFEQMIPHPDFFKNIPMPIMPEIDPRLYPSPLDINVFKLDTTKMTKEEIKKWHEKRHADMKKWAEAQKEYQKKIEPKIAEYQAKIQEWQNANEPKMQEFQMKMEDWQKEFQPKIAEYQAKIQEWQKANEPKMKELELKMKAWQEENQPNLEEFQNKMKIWEEENRPKMEEFQKKMEIWQKENEIKMEEFQIKMQEWQTEHQEQIRKLERSVKERSKKDID